MGSPAWWWYCLLLVLAGVSVWVLVEASERGVVMAGVVRFGVRVAHRRSHLTGMVRRVVDHVNPWDGDGPWAFVWFDDGLRVWVPVGELYGVGFSSGVR